MNRYQTPAFFYIGVRARDGGRPRQHPNEPHPPETVEEARKLVETTRLTFRTIAFKVGVNGGTISRWKDRHGWTRPPGSRASPRRKAGRYVPVLLGRALAQRLRIQADRLLTSIERAPAVDPAALAEAARLLAEAREAQKVRRGRRLEPPPPVEAVADPENPAPKTRRHDRRAAAELGWRRRISKRDERALWMGRKIEE